jgi:hypothetical protein
MGSSKRNLCFYNDSSFSIIRCFLVSKLMKKLLIPLLFLPLLVQAKDIAIAPNGMMGMTVLTNEPCDHNKNIYAAYAYNPNKVVIYACWKVVGSDVVFSHTPRPLTDIPVKHFIKPPENVR